MYTKKIENCISIVDKINYRSVTAKNVAARVHTHLSTRLHLCCSITCILSYRNCIERVFISKEEWKKICARLGFPGLNGICVCVCSSWNKTCMELEGKALSLYRKKEFGKTCCVEKILPRISSSVKYMPIRRQFFFSN
jgi:hypothetical protein